MIFGRYPLWVWPNLLSLDAPLVAVLWQGFIAACFHLPLAWPARATLGLAVWCVYMADRLLDTAREDSQQEDTAVQTPRHRFHREHRRLMTSLLAIALACAIALAVLQMRRVLFHAGLLAGAVVLIYLVAVHHPRSRAVHLPWISKEIVVAFLFTCGTMLAPWLRTDSKGVLLLAAIPFFVLCWANLSLIEAFEWRRLRYSAGSPPHSSTLAIADRYGLFLLLLACYVAALFTLGSSPGLSPILFAALIALCGLLLLARLENRISPIALRVLADAALLSPIPVWALFLR